MKKKTLNHAKLGVFVTAGILFLVLLLYTIGKNHHLLGNNFEIRARFPNARGLMPGNNVRFAGLDAGTVRQVRALNDSTIEATLLIKAEMKGYIKKNGRAFISTDGIMGNKLVNIESSGFPGPPIEEGDILLSKKGADTDEMLAILNNTNNDLAIIASSLKTTISRINASKFLWTVMDDSTLPLNIRSAFMRFRESGDKMSRMMDNLESASAEISSGKGTMGQLIRDSAIAYSIKDAIREIRKTGRDMDSVTISIRGMIDSVNRDIYLSKGMAGSILKDSLMSSHFSSTVKNLEEGTRRFNENMEALKHNFFFRSYFRKIEKKEKKP